MPSFPLQSGGPEPAHLAICGGLLILIAFGVVAFVLLRKRAPRQTASETAPAELGAEAKVAIRASDIGRAILRGLAGFLDLFAKFIALILDALFVAAAPIALVLFNLGWHLYDPNLYKRALAEARIYERFPALISEQMALQLAYAQKRVGIDIENMAATPELEACLRQALGDESFSAIANFEREPTDAELGAMRPCFAQYGREVTGEGEGGGAPPAFEHLTQTDWETLLSILIPTAWLQAQTESVIDQVFAFLDSDAPTLSLDFDLVALREHLAGGAAVEAFLYVVHLQPPCTDEQIAELATAPLSEIPPCLPPDEMLDGMIRQSEDVLSDVLAEMPDQTGLTGIGEQGPGERPGEGSGPLGDNPREALRRIRLISRLSPVLPLALLLLVALFGARSLKGLLRWWGVPLLIVGVVGIGLAFAPLPLMDWAVAVYVRDRLPSTLSPALFEAGLDVARNVVRTVATWIGVEAGAMVLAGLLMLYGRRWGDEGGLPYRAGKRGRMHE